MNDTSGPTLPTPLAHLDPDGSSWRMSQATLISEDQPLLERLPKWGTASDGGLYELPMPERLINVSGFSLLPTPVVNDMGDGKTLDWWQNWIEEKRTQHNNGNGHGKSLSIEVRLLPTPRAQNGEARNMNIWKRPLDQPQNLENALARLTGENTEQPLTDGNTSSDDQHRLL
jgi:hypothetical protein